MDESQTKTNLSETDYDRLELRAHALPFHFFCKKLEKARKHTNASDKVNDFFDEELHSLLRPPPFSLYPILAFMFPNEIIRTYNMQSHSLATLYINTVPIPVNGRDGKRLLHFKDPEINPQPFTGDFGSTLENTLESRRCRNFPSTVLTLGEVDQFLLQLSLANAEDKRKIYHEHLLDKMSPMEHKWFVRIMLDDLRLGFGVNTIFETKKLDYKRLVTRYNMASNLRRVCAELALNGRVDAPRLELFEPFQVHLSNRVVSLEKALEQMKGRPFFMERKIDGERYVVHKQQSEIKLYSRSCREPSAGYYRNLQSTLLQQITVEECILDGEVVTWDKELGTYQPFGSNRHAAIASTDSSNFTLMIVVFDIVYVGGPKGQEILQEMGWTQGNELHQMPLEIRRRVLKRVLTPLRHKIEIVKHVVVKGGVSEKMRLEELTQHFQQAIENKWEGLVVKSLDGKYYFGSQSRFTGTWVKIKPDYVNMGIADMDLVILGVYYGKGGDYGQYLVGLKESDEEEDVENQKYIPIAKVSAGLTDAERKDLKYVLEPHSILGPGSGLAKRDTFPSWIVEWKAAKDDLPDRWILPSRSRLLEIECAEIIESTTYALNYAFRFARIIRVREDKDIRDTTSKREFLEIKDRGITFNPATPLVDSPSPNAFKKKKEYQILNPSSYGAYAPDRYLSDIFLGKTMIVLPGSYVHPQHGQKTRIEVEDMIKHHGGEILPHILHNVDIDYIIGPSIATVMVKHLRKQDKFDILKLSWVLGCIHEGKLLVPQYQDYYCATPETRQNLDMDLWCDPFTKAITNDELEAILHNVPIGSKAGGVDDTTSFLTLKDVVKDQHFEGRVFYVEKNEQNSSSPSNGQAEVVGLPKRSRFNTLDTAEMVLRVYGADVSSTLEARVTTVVRATGTSTSTTTTTTGTSTNELEIVDEDWIATHLTL